MRKKMTQKDWEFVSHRVQKRRNRNRKSEVYFNDRIIESHKLNKELARHISLSTAYESARCWLTCLMIIFMEADLWSSS